MTEKGNLSVTSNSLLEKWSLQTGTMSTGLTTHLQTGLTTKLTTGVTTSSLSSSLLGGTGKKTNDKKRIGTLHSVLEIKKTKVSSALDVNIVSQKFGTSLSLLSGNLLNTNLHTSLKLSSTPLSSNLSLKSSLLSSSSLSKKSQHVVGYKSSFLTDSSSSSSILEKIDDKGVIKRHSELSHKLLKTAKTKKETCPKKQKLQKIKLSYKAFEIPIPKYSLQHEFKKETGLEVEPFLAPDKDFTVSRRLMKPLHDINGMKLALINAVSASLICQPDFKNAKDSARIGLISLSENVAVYDSEFLLKVALYTRKQLNIRTTANFILALAANMVQCRPYLKKYFSVSVSLPSDWIEVAEIYQAFHDQNLKFGSLPSALRRAMIAKFPDFDKYQLAKYNKESSKKKKNKKSKKKDEKIDMGKKWRKTDRLLDSDSSDGDDDEEDEEDDEAEMTSKHKESDVHYEESSDFEEDLEQKTFTLKQLIRKLHIREPVEHVMCLIGKKYPNTPEEFYQTRLPGMWEEERAGKRMKLPVPETWETQVSMKGNKASVWEDLIDHKKLPFMAMLRNLRNLIKAGISTKHHNSILSRLTNERQVINSKQFPFRFFSAYEVLTQLEKDYEQNQKDIITAAENAAMTSGIQGGRKGRGGAVGVTGSTRGRGRGRGRGGSVSWWIIKKQRNKTNTEEVPYDTNLIQRYRRALDTAVKIATVYNVQPIKGQTIIFCDVGKEMEIPCTAAKGLGKPRQMKEVAVLLGLMCKYSCEECELIVYDHENFASIDITKGTILDNMDTVLNTPLHMRGNKKELFQGVPYQILVDVLRDRIQVDNLIILSGGLNPDTAKGRVMSDFLKVYRRIVNPNMLYVSVSFAGRNCGFTESIKPEHNNDIYISGYSDQILRFIAERGDGGQLMHVEKIDEAFNLKPLPVHALQHIPKPPVKTAPARLLPLTVPTPRWRTVRVFISSTFRDMHGERDLLTRFVFPELRALAQKHFINVYEVDLRWGVTEEQTRENRTLELCLQEVSKCQFFIGILGNRYGFVPDKYTVPDTPEFDWMKEYTPGASVTELEMYFAALSRSEDVQDKAFFYIRDSSFEKDVPKEFQSDFLSENEASGKRLNRLKDGVRKSSLEVFDGYPCHWGGVVDTKPFVAGLDEFGLRVLNNIWTAIQKHYPDEDAVLDEDSHISKLHQAFIDNRQSQFIGRKTLIKECIKKLVHMKTGILCLTGKSGCGKSSLVSSLVHTYVESQHCVSASSVLVHIVGAAAGSTNIVATLRRLCHELNTQFGLLSLIPQDYKNLVIKFAELLSESAKICGSTLLVVIDGLDLMEESHQPYNMEWLPQPVPDNVIFVVSVMVDERCHKSLKRFKAKEIVVGGLDVFDKIDVVRTNLSAHRKMLDETPFNNQMKLLVGKKEAHNPLFLKLACEELRVFGVFEKISTKLKSLPPTVPTILQDVLNRLEIDHGKTLVSTALSLLVCAREGLLDGELWDLLSWHQQLAGTKFNVKDLTNLETPSVKRLPPITFSYLKRSIQEFLNPTGSWNPQLSLAHKEIVTAIRHRYFKGLGADNELMLHTLLAGYWYSLADPDKDGSWRSNYTRAFSELPYHLVCCGDFCDLEDVLCDLRFIHAKSQLGLMPLILEDFNPKATSNRFLEKKQTRFLGLPRVQQYKSFISRNLHILTSHPALTWQQAINDPPESFPSRDAQTLHRNGQISDHMLYMEWSNKPRSVDPCYLTISSLQQPATCVDISPESRYVATGSLDGLVRLYNMDTAKLVKTLHGHADAISDVCFAGKGTLCSASVDNTLSLWNVEDGHRIAVLKEHQRRVNSCASDSTGSLVASAGWDCQIKIWNTNTGAAICSLSAGSPVNAVDFHPEGQLIATGCWDSTIKIWDIFHRTRKAILRGHSSSVRDVAYSPSGRHIASASMDGDVKIWSATNGSQVGSICGHALPINKLIFTPTGKELITVSDDHKVKIWSGHLGVPLHCLGSEKNGPVTSVALSSTGEMVAAGFHDGHTRIFDVNTGMMLAEVKHNSACIRAMTYCQKGKYIISGSDDCTVLMLDGHTGSKVASFEGHTKPVLCVTATDKYVASAGEDYTCLIFKGPKKALKSKRLTPEVSLNRHTGPITSCTFNSDSSKLATASRDSSVIIWDMFTVDLDPNPEPEKILHACHSDWINDCQWSNIGDYLVTASNDFNLKVWDVKSGSEKIKLVGHMSAVNKVVYQYGCIVSACSDGSVKVWSHKGSEITTLYGHTQRVNSCDILVKVKGGEEVEDEEEEEMDWSSMQEEASKPKTNTSKPLIKMDEVVVATCGDDGLIRLWLPLQANELVSLMGHSDRVLSVSSDKSGNVVSCSLDKSVRLWAPELSGEKVKDHHDAEITLVVSCVDGSTVLTGSRDGIIKLWCDSENNSAFLQCVYSFKAHDKSVNCATFLNRQGLKFVTGSDENSLIFWDIVRKKDCLFVKKCKTFVTTTPVTCLAWNQFLPSKSGLIFFSAQWDGSVLVWNTDRESPVIQFCREKKTGFYKIWITKMSFSAATPTQLLTADTDGNILILNTEQIFIGSYKEPEMIGNFVIKSEEIDKEIEPQKRQSNWILDVVQKDKTMFCGDSEGQITLIENGQISITQKIHGEGITGVVVDDNTLITASTDQTIKVWTKDLNQIGQFFCSAPVTGIAMVTRTSNKLHLVSGDSLGNIYHLCWCI